MFLFETFEAECGSELDGDADEVVNRIQVLFQLFSSRMKGKMCPRVEGFTTVFRSSLLAFQLTSYLD